MIMRMNEIVAVRAPQFEVSHPMGVPVRPACSLR
jgi:hypothetical protein